MEFYDYIGIFCVVEAGGCIEVTECVGKVKLMAGRNIILKAGSNGNDEGELICNGDIYARFIESAEVVCRHNIFCEEAIMHSLLYAYGNILLKGKKAEIIGGKSVITGYL